MNLQHRLDLMVRLGEYVMSDDEHWQIARQKATALNTWFIPQFIQVAVENISNCFLQRNKLNEWVAAYNIPPAQDSAKAVGIVMAGNVPLVGFHDLLCVFISGHRAICKASTKDEALIKHLVKKLSEWDTRVKDTIRFEPMLKGCDAYIATGSNNTSRYFEYYFGKYNSIIRANRSSLAILSGEETEKELEDLSDDVYQYFGLGCRNVTKLLVPRDYDFVALLEAFRKYSYFEDHNKYKNNFDYNLALHVLNKQYYMTNGSILLIESPSLFSPISQLNYEFYDKAAQIPEKLHTTESIQCIVGSNFVPFGRAQEPGLNDYADGIDTLDFLLRL